VGFVRFIILSLERPPKEILAAVKVKDRRAKLLKQGGGDSPLVTTKVKEKEKEKEKETKKKKEKHVARDIKHIKPILVNKYVSLARSLLNLPTFPPRKPTSLYTTELSRVVVARGSAGTFQVDRQVDVIGAKLMWSFKTEDKDIAFGIYFQELDGFARVRTSLPPLPSIPLPPLRTSTPSLIRLFLLYRKKYSLYKGRLHTYRQ